MISSASTPASRACLVNWSTVPFVPVDEGGGDVLHGGARFREEPDHALYLVGALDVFLDLVADEFVGDVGDVCHGISSFSCVLGRGATLLPCGEWP